MSEVSELLWRGTSGTLINHLLRHQTVLPDHLRVTNLACGLTHGALKSTHYWLFSLLLYRSH